MWACLFQEYWRYFVLCVTKLWCWMVVVGCLALSQPHATNFFSTDIHPALEIFCTNLSYIILVYVCWSKVAVNVCVLWDILGLWGEVDFKPSDHAWKSPNLWESYLMFIEHLLEIHVISCVVQWLVRWTLIPLIKALINVVNRVFRGLIAQNSDRQRHPHCSTSTQHLN